MFSFGEKSHLTFAMSSPLRLISDGFPMPKAHLVGDADFGDGHRVEAHESGGYGVDGYLVGGCEDDVLGVDAHGAGAGSVAGECAVHDCEESAVDFALDLEKVY